MAPYVSHTIVVKEGLEIDTMTQLKLAKGGFFSERADAFVISSNRQT